MDETQSLNGESRDNLQTYPLKNNDTEQQRLGRLQTYFKTIFETNHLVPLNNPQRILDVGCGFGNWAVEIADEYPSSQVIGVDIQPVKTSNLPPNVHLQYGNVLDGLPFEDSSFDFIASRALAAGIKFPQWPKYVRELLRLLKPGGWIQLIEQDGLRSSDDNSIPPPEKSAWRKLELEFFVPAQETTGQISHGLPEKLKGFLEDAGFENIEETFIKSPLGTWSNDPKLKSSGAMLTIIWSDIIDSIRPLLKTVMPEQAAEAFHLSIKEDVDSLTDQYHSYLNMVAVIGRKPAL